MREVFRIDCASREFVKIRDFFLSDPCVVAEVIVGEQLRPFVPARSGICVRRGSGEPGTVEAETVSRHEPLVLGIVPNLFCSHLSAEGMIAEEVTVRVRLDYRFSGVGTTLPRSGAPLEFSVILSGLGAWQGLQDRGGPPHKLIHVNLEAFTRHPNENLPLGETPLAQSEIRVVEQRSGASPDLTFVLREGAKYRPFRIPLLGFKFAGDIDVSPKVVISVIRHPNGDGEGREPSFLSLCEVSCPEKGCTRYRPGVRCDRLADCPESNDLRRLQFERMLQPLPKGQETSGSEVRTFSGHLRGKGIYAVCMDIDWLNFNLREAFLPRPVAGSEKDSTPLRLQLTIQVLLEERGDASSSSEKINCLTANLLFEETKAAYDLFWSPGGLQAWCVERNSHPSKVIQQTISRDYRRLRELNKVRGGQAAGGDSAPAVYRTSFRPGDAPVTVLLARGPDQAGIGGPDETSAGGGAAPVAFVDSGQKDREVRVRLEHPFGDGFDLVVAIDLGTMGTTLALRRCRRPGELSQPEVLDLSSIAIVNELASAGDHERASSSDAETKRQRGIEGTGIISSRIGLTLDCGARSRGGTAFEEPPHPGELKWVPRLGSETLSAQAHLWGYDFAGIRMDVFETHLDLHIPLKHKPKGEGVTVARVPSAKKSIAERRIRPLSNMASARAFYRDDLKRSFAAGRPMPSTSIADIPAEHLLHDIMAVFFCIYTFAAQIKSADGSEYETEHLEKYLINTNARLTVVATYPPSISHSAQESYRRCLEMVASRLDEIQRVAGWGGGLTRNRGSINADAQILPEPVAACFHYLAEEKLPLFGASPDANRGHLILFDVGAGTIDVSAIGFIPRPYWNGWRDAQRPVVATHPVCFSVPMGGNCLDKALLDDVREALTRHCRRSPRDIWDDGEAAALDRIDVGKRYSDMGSEVQDNWLVVPRDPKASKLEESQRRIMVYTRDGDDDPVPQWLKDRPASPGDWTHFAVRLGTTDGGYEPIRFVPREGTRFAAYCEAVWDLVVVPALWAMRSNEFAASHTRIGFIGRTCAFPPFARWLEWKTRTFVDDRLLRPGEKPDGFAVFTTLSSLNHGHSHEETIAESKQAVALGAALWGSNPEAHAAYLQDEWGHRITHFGLLVLSQSQGSRDCDTFEKLIAFELNKPGRWDVADNECVFLVLRPPSGSVEDLARRHWDNRDGARYFDHCFRPLVETANDGPHADSADRIAEAVVSINGTPLWSQDHAIVQGPCRVDFAVTLDSNRRFRLTFQRMGEALRHSLTFVATFIG